MKRIPATISKLTRLTPTLIELEVARRDGRQFPYYLPGQYATVSFPNRPRLRGERSFSIASSPHGLLRLSFGIRVGGAYTKNMSVLSVGEPIDIGGPYGQFTFDPLRDRSAVFVAGGIGITPLLSMIRFASQEQLPNSLLLIYSVRSLVEAAYYEELEAMVQANPYLRVLYVVADGKIPVNNPRFVSGRITNTVLDRALEGVVVGSTYFLCGPPPFMGAITKQLRTAGVPLADIRSERFSVGSSDLIERGSVMPKIMLTAGSALVVAMVGTIFRIEQSKRAVVRYVPYTTTTSTTPTNTNTPDISNIAVNTNTTVDPTPVTNTGSTPVTTPTTLTPTPTPTPTHTPPVYTPPVVQYVPSPRTRVS